MAESFVERTLPPRRPAGPEIPLGVRDALLSWFAQHGVDLDQIAWRLCLEHGYGSDQDVADDIRERWGPDEADDFLQALKYDKAAAWTFLRHVPEPLFLDALQHGLALVAEDLRQSGSAYEYASPNFPAGVAVINKLFERRGIAYRITQDGQAEWHGDEGLYAQVVRPALDALDDARLAGCRQEFEAALGHLRAGTTKDREDAIEEVAKAVESAMKVLLDSRGVGRTGKKTSEPLWNLLRENDVVPEKTKDAILGTSRLRNEYGGHGAGGAVREIPDGIPELAVRTAASAIAYLAGLMP